MTLCKNCNERHELKTLPRGRKYCPNCRVVQEGNGKGLAPHEAPWEKYEGAQDD